MTKADMMSPSSTFSLASDRTSLLEAQEHNPFDTVVQAVGNPPPAAVLSGSIPLSSPPADDMMSYHQSDSLRSETEVSRVSSTVQKVVPLPTPPFYHPTRSHGLRLPSFDELGIGFPHPDDLGAAHSCDRIGAVGGGASDRSQKDAILTPPPEDVPAFQIQSLSSSPGSPVTRPEARLPASSLSSSPSSPPPPPHPHPHPQAPRNAHADLRARPQSLSRSEPSHARHTASPHAEQEMHGSHGVERQRTQSISVEGLDQRFAWLAPAIMAVASCVSSTEAYTGSLKVLSHALPAPTMPGHVYAHIVDTVRAQCAPGQMQWINLMHAVPGRLNLADLPSSPPATPGPSIGGQDYFTTKVFNSAVTTISDNEEGTVTPRAASDRLLSAPGSIELSIVERYIPPCTPNEVNNMFSLRDQSILVDRLVELAPRGGCLTLIYPTRAGAQTFLDRYLAPVLDPILRSMISLHSLSTDFGQAVSESKTVRNMLAYPDLLVQLQRLCERLNQNDGPARARLHGVSGRFELVYSDEVEVELSSKVWSSWWVRQEKMRLQRAISHYFVRGRRLPEDGKYQQAVLVEQLLNGLVKEASSARPECGVALGVFVIKRGD